MTKERVSRRIHEISKFISTLWVPVIIAWSLILSFTYSFQTPFLHMDSEAALSNAIHKNNSFETNESRFQQLKQTLPITSHMGYINTWSSTHTTMDVTAYYQAQYALAPLLVTGIVSGTTSPYPYIVGDFGTSYGEVKVTRDQVDTQTPNTVVDISEISVRMRLQVVENFGRGVVLFRNLNSAK